MQELAHSSWSIDDMPPCEDHLFAYRVAGRVKVNRRLSGRWTSVAASRSSITITPAHHATSWRLDGDGALLQIYLPAELLRQAAGEHLPNGVEYAIFEHLGVHDARLNELADRLSMEIKTKEIGFALYAETIISQIAVLMLRDYGPRPSRGSSGSRFDKRIERRLIEHIELRRTEKITLGNLAAIANLGTSQFNAQFKASFGLPPYEYVIRSRVEFAKQLLAGRELSLAEVALAAGFANQSHLTRTFKRVCGATPQVYRDNVTRSSAGPGERLIVQAIAG